MNNELINELVRPAAGGIVIDQTVKQFTDRFLKPPKGDSPEDVVARIRHWIDVANRPEAYVGGDTSPYAISAKIRSARQNIRRLVRRHPEVAGAMMQMSEAVQ